MNRCVPRLLGLVLGLIALPLGCGPGDELPRVPDYTPSPEAPTTVDAVPPTNEATEPVIPGSRAGVNMPE